jgi:hypothetical protein
MEQDTFGDITIDNLTSENRELKAKLEASEKALERLLHASERLVDCMSWEGPKMDQMRKAINYAKGETD